MSEDPLWELAGPRLFAREVETAVRERINVLIPTRAREMPTRLMQGLRDYLHSRQCHLRDTETDASSCQEVIRNVVEAPYTPLLADFCQSVGNIGILIAVTTPEAFVVWSEFLLRWQDATRRLPSEDRPCLIVIGSHPDAEKLSRRQPDVTLKYLDWDSALSLPDLESFAWARIRREAGSGTLRKILARTTAELSCGDAKLAAHLAGLKPAEITSPTESLKQWRKAVEAAGECVPPEIWFEDDWRPHPAHLVLAADAPKRIGSILWRAQAAILLPWADGYRGQLLPAIRDRLVLKNARGEPVRDADELEIGEIHYQIVNAGRHWEPRVKNVFTRLREIRNRMAHRQSFLWDDLKCHVDRIEANRST